MQIQLEQPASLGTPNPPANSAATPAATPAYDNLSLARNMKIGLFHIGSSLADILANGVWNRVMIKELGFAATPIALLLALRYFLAPFSVWVGRRSDRHPIFGYHRLPYVWGGRLIIVLSYITLGLSTVALAGTYDGVLGRLSFGQYPVNIHNATAHFWGWAGIVLSLVAFSVGSTISSTVFLSLLYDRAPQQQRTRAISVVWIFLIAGFAVAGILYSRILPIYSRDAFLSLFITAPLIMAGLFFFALVGEERPSNGAARLGSDGAAGKSFWQEMRAVWASVQTRLFFLFLALSNVFFYTQDVILEPFAGQIFNMPLATTNRFSTYWGSMTLLTIVICLLLARRYPARFSNMALSRWGVIILGITFALFALCSLLGIRALVTINLVLMGVGLGMWTVGSLGLMMDMTRLWGAGLYLALWTVASTLARGTGVAMGGISLDLGLWLSGQNQAVAYGGVFLFQGLGFLLTLYLLGKINPKSFAQETAQPAAVMANSID
jgi:MFS transporter, BCD family, chlorophyll transporter